MDKKQTSIFETENYKQFKIADWNRDVSEKNLNKIDKSVKKYGWRVQPIIVNENNEIIDGQHRYMYAKLHELPLYYMRMEGMTKEDCQIMNACRTQWSIDDFIKFYANQGNINFLRLQGLKNEYSFLNISSIVAIAKRTLNGNYQSTDIKKGTLKIINEEYNHAREVLSWLNSFHKYIDACSRQKSINIFCDSVLLSLEAD